MSAAIVISDREVDLSERYSAIFGPDVYWVISQPMSLRSNPPRDNLIYRNRIAGNAASGIYVDGGVANVIAGNTVEGNAKEGICLDNGATANVVSGNSVAQNGMRWGESDSILEKDSIRAGGRLPDGSPAAKVPGISIDNAAYNIVFGNHVARNFGGGIKIVRTGFFNLIGMNTIFDNNRGSSDRFHFFGIELGSAKLDSPSDELDGAPSRGNIVFSNLIRGSHYAGVFFAAGSSLNDVFDNVILDAEKWALESVAPMPNSSLNNLTNLPSRNIGSGLSPALLDPRPAH
jgi:parallel beta-helix repeat protein